MLIEDLRVDFAHGDERGSLVQLLHERCGQVNVLKSVKGTVRGNHFHRISTESFYVVSGSVEVSCEGKGDKAGKETRVFSEGDFFRIPPDVLHSMTFPEDCVLVAIYDICVEKEDGSKDIWNEGAFYG